MEGACRVYKSDLLNDLVADAKEAEARDGRAAARARGKGSEKSAATPFGASEHPRLSSEARLLAQKEMREARYREKTEQSLRDAERRRAEKARRREEAFQRMYASVCEGLDGGDGVVREVSEKLEEHARLRRKKAATLHNEWKEAVFDTIQGRVQEQIDNMSTKDAAARRAEAYDTYIRTVNAKALGGVFRDIIIPSDYDPLTLREHTLKYDGRVKDPIKRDLTKAMNERRDMGLSAQSTQARQTLDVQKWATENIGSTPYGHDARLFDDQGNFVKNNTGFTASMTKSKVNMDHYNVETGKEAMLKETQKSKRMFPGMNSASTVEF